MVVNHNGEMIVSGVMFLVTVLATITTTHAALPPSLRYPLPVAINKITEVTAFCDAGSLNVTVSLRYPFKGLLFARDFSQECRVLGSLTNSVSINLPTSGCGVRLSTKKDDLGNEQMYYSVTLVIQQDRHLRQISDQERHVDCLVGGSAFTVKSDFMIDVVKNEIMDMEIQNHRTGRMKAEGWSKDEIGTTMTPPSVGKELNEALSAARAWMEIVPEQENVSRDTLQVGESALLSVKCTLPVGIGWRVIDCTAHDGLGDSSQKLLDDQGCPIDDLILPTLKLGPPRPIALMRHQEAVAKFAAFKFPDRDRLHLSCGLQLCRGPCEKFDCKELNKTFENRLGRTLARKGEQGEVLDRLEVFNSVEVLAPRIELDDVTTRERMANNDITISPFGYLPGDRTFCVSPDKMAITFCILGMIFLCAVIVAACALMRARRSGIGMQYYTRSLFSSSSGGSGFGGSKLLLHESPTLGQSSSTRGMPYGRML